MGTQVRKAIRDVLGRGISITKNSSRGCPLPAGQGCREGVTVTERGSLIAKRTTAHWRSRSSPSCPKLVVVITKITSDTKEPAATEPEGHADGQWNMHLERQNRQRIRASLTK